MELTGLELIRIDNVLKKFKEFKSLENILSPKIKKEELFGLLDEYKTNLIKEGLTKHDIKLIKEIKTQLPHGIHVSKTDSEKKSQKDFLKGMVEESQIKHHQGTEKLLIVGIVVAVILIIIYFIYLG